MRINFDLQSVDQVEQIIRIYKKYAKLIKRDLMEMSPSDTGTLKKAIQYRVIRPPKNAKNSPITLMVGILDKKSKAHKYVNFIVNGNRRHFVPVKTGSGRYTGILGWAKRHGLVYFGTSSKSSTPAWRWSSGRLQGNEFTGMMAENRGNRMFDLLYKKYYTKINSEISKVLGGKKSG
jgi:hypothetical protein